MARKRNPLHVARDGRALREVLSLRWQSGHPAEASSTVPVSVPRDAIFELVELVAAELDRVLARYARYAPNQTMRRMSAGYDVVRLSRVLDSLLNAEREHVDSLVGYSLREQPTPEPELEEPATAELERLDDPAGQRMTARLVELGR